jgi:L-cystine transport system permease protein
MEFDPLFFLQALLEASTAIPRSLGIAAAALLIGLVFSMPIALIRFYRVPYLSGFFKLLITVSKGLPQYLLFLSLFVMMSTIPWATSYHAAIAAMSFVTITRMAELFRGTLESVDKSQFDAAYSIGHPAATTFFRIVLPQIVSVSLPMMGNVIIWTLKGIPVASMIGVNDILSTAISAAVVNYRYIEAYLAAGLIFWAIFVIVEKSSAVLEDRFKLQARKGAA